MINIQLPPPPVNRSPNLKKKLTEPLRRPLNSILALPEALADIKYDIPVCQMENTQHRKLAPSQLVPNSGQFSSKAKGKA